VADNDDTVSRQVDIDLQTIRPCSETTVERGYGVFWSQGASTSMGEHSGPNGAKKRHNAEYNAEGPMRNAQNDGMSITLSIQARALRLEP
jgi:hypothetical protein